MGQAKKSSFAGWARLASDGLGTTCAFAGACSVIGLWFVTGPLFGFSDTWQLIINTGTTIVTFLMVFLIQNTQNRDARALHLKLDEIINATESARNKLIDLEHCTDDEIDRLQQQFTRLRQQSMGPSSSAVEASAVAKD
jgi:low affinity Fe/Cu permease